MGENILFSSFFNKNFKYRLQLPIKAFSDILNVYFKYKISLPEKSNFLSIRPWKKLFFNTFFYSLFCRVFSDSVYTFRKKYTDLQGYFILNFVYTCVCLCVFSTDVLIVDCVKETNVGNTMFL